MTSTSGHRVHVVIVSVNVVVNDVSPSVAPNALQASMCDEQLVVAIPFLRSRCKGPTTSESSMIPSVSTTCPFSTLYHF